MQSKTTLLTYSALMCSLIIVSALWLKFNIPGTEILVTLQVLFILLCGQLLPPLYCLYTIGTYLFIGLMGIPVFSAASGPAVILTPTFGYLLGFFFCAAGTSWMRCKLKDHKYGDYLASTFGVLGFYAITMLYIFLLKGVILSDSTPVSALFAAYCLPFLPLDLGKGLLAAVVGGRLRTALRLA